MSLDNGMASRDDDEVTESSESFENFSFVTNASMNRSACNWNESKVGNPADETIAGLAFHTAAELGEFFHMADTLASYNRLNPDPVM